MIEDFYIASDQGELDASNEITDGQVTIIGHPLHTEIEDLKNKYVNCSLDDFLAYEARYSAGNYVLVDLTNGPGELRIITSPGYRSGYIRNTQNGFVLSTAMNNILEYISIDELQVQASSLLQHFESRKFLPYSTPFKNVNKLKAGYVISWEDKDIQQQECYIQKSKNAPSNIDEYFKEISNIYKGEKPILALSGHIDSTALAVALSENEVDFTAVTFDMGPTSTHPAEGSE